MATQSVALLDEDFILLHGFKKKAYPKSYTGYAEYIDSIGITLYCQNRNGRCFFRKGDHYGTDFYGQEWFEAAYERFRIDGWRGNSL